MQTPPNIGMDNNQISHRYSSQVMILNCTVAADFVEGPPHLPMFVESCQLPLLDRPLWTISDQDWTRVGLKCIPTLFSNSISPHTPVL